jgi:hypothetical protein
MKYLKNLSDRCIDRAYNEDNKFDNIDRTLGYIVLFLMLAPIFVLGVAIFRTILYLTIII